MRAINSGIMKAYNRRIVLNLIRRQPISRAELSDSTLLTRASITQIIDELMADGLVEETSVVGRKRYGRRLTQLELVKNSRCFIGISLSSTRYHLSVINLCGDVLYHCSDSIVEREPDDVLNVISGNLKRAVYQLGLSHEQILGIGVCVPGPLDTRKGIILKPAGLERWHDYPIVNRLEEALGFKVTLCTMANAQALDELYFGIGCKDVHSFMLLDIDESVSAGIILHDRLFVGAHGHTPEIGHVSVVPNGIPCYCGNRGCLEKYVSPASILSGTSFSSWKDVVDSQDSDPAARELMEQVSCKLAHGLINIINTFDLEKFILSGCFSYGGDQLVDRINDLIRGHCICCTDDAPVVAGSAPNLPRIAAIAAYHRFFTDC